MKIFGWAWNIGRGFVRSIFLKISLVPVVASMSSLIPFALANILQAAALILQCNSLVNKCFEIWKGVYDQLAFKCWRQTVQKSFHPFILSHMLIVGITR